MVENYNENVGEFNDRYAQEAREFTQGDFSDGRINIYTYTDEQELTTVLIHELGHAMSLEHVDGSSSMMYFQIGEQPLEFELSATDLSEFNRVCGSMSLWDKLVYKLANN